MNAIILCGGLSTRLGEITKERPKILLDIKGRPVLDWQIDKLKEIGVAEVVLAAGHLSEALQREVGESRLGVKIIYALEPERLGTGGAIKFAWQFVVHPEEPVIILNGDIMSAIDLADMVKCLRFESEGIILGAKVDDASSYGTLDFSDGYRLKSFKEKEGLNKPGYINGGFYLFNARARKYFDAVTEMKFSVEYDVFPKMNDLDVYSSDRAWIDVGVPERLEWARNNWQE
ncbi:MAG: sugar phosphate nucleotidyltransferase [Patescibacteria group bacterium]